MESKLNHRQILITKVPRGTETVYKLNNIHHRIGKPATIVEYDDGVRVEHYKVNNTLHRLDGPAYIKTDKYGKVIEKLFYLGGTKIDESKYDRTIKEPSLLKQYFVTESDFAKTEDLEQDVYEENAEELVDCCSKSISTPLSSSVYFYKDKEGKRIALFEKRVEDVSLTYWYSPDTNQNYHRVGKPAYIKRKDSVVVYESYYQYDLKHNEFGPAEIDHANKKASYFIKGKLYSKEDFIKKIKEEGKNKIKLSDGTEVVFTDIEYMFDKPASKYLEKSNKFNCIKYILQDGSYVFVFSNGDFAYADKFGYFDRAGRVAVFSNGKEYYFEQGAEVSKEHYSEACKDPLGEKGQTYVFPEDGLLINYFRKEEEPQSVTLFDKDDNRIVHYQPKIGRRFWYKKGCHAWEGCEYFDSKEYFDEHYTKMSKSDFYNRFVYKITEKIDEEKKPYVPLKGKEKRFFSFSDGLTIAHYGEKEQVGSYLKFFDENGRTLIMYSAVDGKRFWYSGKEESGALWDGYEDTVLNKYYYPQAGGQVSKEAFYESLVNSRCEISGAKFEKKTHTFSDGLSIRYNQKISTSESEKFLDEYSSLIAIDYPNQKRRFWYPRGAVETFLWNGMEKYGDSKGYFIRSTGGNVTKRDFYNVNIIPRCECLGYTFEELDETKDSVPVSKNYFCADFSDGLKVWYASSTDITKNCVSLNDENNKIIVSNDNDIKIRTWYSKDGIPLGFENYKDKEYKLFQGVGDTSPVSKTKFYEEVVVPRCKCNFYDLVDDGVDGNMEVGGNNPCVEIKTPKPYTCQDYTVIKYFESYWNESDSKINTLMFFDEYGNLITKLYFRKSGGMFKREWFNEGSFIGSEHFEFINTENLVNKVACAYFDKYAAHVDYAKFCTLIAACSHIVTFTGNAEIRPYDMDIDIGTIERKEETMPNTPDSKNVKDIILSDFHKSKYRFGQSQGLAAAKHLMLAGLKKNKETLQHTEGFAKFLDTKTGEALLSFGIGLGLTYAPKVSENKHVQEMAKEFRVDGMFKVGDEVADQIKIHILPVLLKATTILPEKEPEKKVRVRVSEEKKESVQENNPEPVRQSRAGA
ncbi:MAG TPA: hypothetical protein VMX17_10365 [Candidatus Glassbacteria bacterium]|nr:hypothetical protein [Candidatus Glassbacteria bacterium]